MARQLSARVRRRRFFVILGAIVVLLGVAVAIAWALGAPREVDVKHPLPTATKSAKPTPTPTPTETPAPTPPAFDKTAHSVDDPTSIWVVSNKSRALNPVNYEPADIVYPDVPYVNRQGIRAVAADSLVQLFAAAQAEAGASLAVQSGYRSYETQVRVYNNEVAANGVAAADSDTARPGHSEHQTGLTVDISAPSEGCTLQACFGETDAGAWLAQNAWRFGFLLRYPADKVDVTGYTYEPWHFRYIGPELATELHNTGVTTLEEFFGVPGGTEYH